MVPLVMDAQAARQVPIEAFAAWLRGEIGAVGFELLLVIVLLGLLGLAIAVIVRFDLY